MSDVKVLKLTTGEEIIARVEQQRDYMMLEKPMTMAPVPGQTPGQMGFAMVPWMMVQRVTSFNFHYLILWLRQKQKVRLRRIILHLSQV